MSTATAPALRIHTADGIARDFAAVPEREITFRQHQWLMRAGAQGRIHQGAVSEEAFLIAVLESGCASDLLAGSLVEIVDGVPAAWSWEQAVANARLFDQTAGSANAAALTGALTGVLLPFWRALRRSSTTSPSSSTGTPTETPTAGAQPVATAAPAISETSSPSSAPSAARRPSSTRSSTGRSATGSSRSASGSPTTRSASGGTRR